MTMFECPCCDGYGADEGAGRQSPDAGRKKGVGVETMKQILRCELADGVRHDWEPCGAIEPIPVTEDRPPENFYLCSQPKGHAGPHIACSSFEHNLATWPNATEAPAELRQTKRCVYCGSIVDFWIDQTHEHGTICLSCFEARFAKPPMAVNQCPGCGMLSNGKTMGSHMCDNGACDVRTFRSRRQPDNVKHIKDALERGEIAFAPILIPPGPVEFSALEARISALECDSHKPVSIPIGALEARIAALERQIRELNPGLPPL